MSSNQQQAIPDQQPNLVWDALKEVYNNCGAFTVMPAALIPLMRDKELVAKVADQPALVNLSKILADDVKDYVGRLQHIRTMHQDRSGSSTDPDDLMRSTQIFELYFEWAHSYEGVVLPTMSSIVDLLAAAGGDVSNIPLTVQSVAPADTDQA